MRSFTVTETAICQTARHRRKSHSLLTFDAGAEKPIFACAVELPVRHGIFTRGHRYPRSVVFNYSRTEWLFKDVTAFTWNFLVTKSRILRSAQLSSGMSTYAETRSRLRPNFRRNDVKECENMYE